MIDVQQLAELAKKYVDLSIDPDDPFHDRYVEIVVTSTRLIDALSHLPDEQEPTQEAS